MSQFEAQGEKFAQEISSFVNGSPLDARLHAAKRMARDHNTLQQNMMGLFMMFVEEMSKKNPDMRNEDSVELAKAIMALPDRLRILRHI